MWPETGSPLRPFAPSPSPSPHARSLARDGPLLQHWDARPYLAQINMLPDSHMVNPSPNMARDLAKSPSFGGRKALPI